MRSNFNVLPIELQDKIAEDLTCAQIKHLYPLFKLTPKIINQGYPRPSGKASIHTNTVFLDALTPYYDLFEAKNLRLNVNHIKNIARKYKIPNLNQDQIKEYVINYINSHDYQFRNLVKGDVYSDSKLNMKLIYNGCYFVRPYMFTVLDDGVPLDYWFRKGKLIPGINNDFKLNIPKIRSQLLETYNNYRSHFMVDGKQYMIAFERTISENEIIDEIRLNDDPYLTYESYFNWNVAEPRALFWHN